MKHNKNTQKNDSRLDRRGFLKSSSAIAGSAVALGSLSIERGAFAQSSDTIKVALVGCGGLSLLPGDDGGLDAEPRRLDALESRGDVGLRGQEGPRDGGHRAAM